MAAPPKRLQPDPDNADCPAPFHGDDNAYRNATPPCRCPSAREAHRLFVKRCREGRHQSRIVPALGAARRLRALAAAGWTWTEIAKRLGYHKSYFSYLACTAEYIHQETHAEIVALYEELRHEPGGYVRTARAAARRGWLPPEQWLPDELDDPAADPGAPPPLGEDFVDDGKVEQAVAGRLKLSTLTRHEQDAAVTRALALMTGVEASKRLQTTERQIERVKARLRDQETPTAPVLELHRAATATADDEAA